MKARAVRTYEEFRRLIPDTYIKKRAEHYGEFKMAVGKELQRFRNNGNVPPTRTEKDRHQRWQNWLAEVEFDISADTIKNFDDDIVYALARGQSTGENALAAYYRLHAHLADLSFAENIDKLVFNKTLREKGIVVFEATPGMRAQSAESGSEKVAENPACFWGLYPVEAKAVLREICSFSLFDRQPPRTGGDVAIFLEVSALSTPDENGRRYGFGELVVRLLFTGKDVSSLEYNSWYNRERNLSEGKFAKLFGSGSDTSMRLRSEPGYLDGRYEILEQGHFLKIRSIENEIEFLAQLEFNKQEKSLVYADGESLASDTKAALISLIESEQYGESNHLLGWLVLNVHKYQIKPVCEKVGV
ncbi:hypothetical protein [Stappia sp. ES.058]|uniref:hypothetical protein n=1 Tax=Stappia sp. ES.058 TaxID=1881061 RepID=UPI00087C933A|nr:hypothetical protein [Stappia sp. ES.058]SDU42541.1 hypothetical protein SAMN05428979_3703 [Stappia sp. ES.058]